MRRANLNLKELIQEVEFVAGKREDVFRLLKDESDNLKLEKKVIQDQHKQDVESFSPECEYFMNKMVQEHFEWFNRIQKKHGDFLMGIKMQKRKRKKN